MTAADIQVFLGGILAYFRTVSTSQQAEVGTPFVIDADFRVLHYTGIIGISGARKGCVYFTADREILVELARRILGEEAERNEDLIVDLVGEIANTISGQARRELGPNFNISVPVALAGRPERLKTMCRLPSFVIPIRWAEQKAFLVVCLD